MLNRAGLRAVVLEGLDKAFFALERFCRKSFRLPPTTPSGITLLSPDFIMYHNESQRCIPKDC